MNEPGDDLNALAAAALRDLAAVQSSPQKRFGYKRAARAIQHLERQFDTYLTAEGELQKIPHIGPASSRVLREILHEGRSPTVEAAVDSSGKARDVERSRALRGHFLSRARVLATLSDASLEGPALRAYRGDLQMHSTWSDGSQSLEEIIQEGMRRGYQYSAVTDHSYGLPVARGLSMDRVRDQHLEIDRLNATYAGRFRLLKGIEANISAAGEMDLAREELSVFEIVVAAPHSALRSPADQTARLVKAVETPGVHILGHPRGRMYGSRAGVQASWQEVFEAAARTGVAVEIDGDPARQDLDFELARLAVEAGCLFALDSDAHAVDEFINTETAIAHARLAGVAADRVVNAWPLPRLLDWAARLTHR